MSNQIMKLEGVQLEIKTPNKLCGLIYDTSIVPSTGKVIAGKRESGEIFIGMMTEFDQCEFNFLVSREEALAIITALVSAIKSQEQGGSKAVVGGN